jgi:hypothetical protein
MLRKTLLAATVGVLISPVAMAGDINSQTVKTAWSNEALGLAGANDVVTGGDLTAVLGAEFAVNDVITLAFSGAALDDTSALTTVIADGTACPGLAGDQCSTVTFGLLSADSSTATYRVTEIDTASGDTTVGLPVPFALENDLEFDVDAVQAGGGVTVSYSAETNNGLPLDTSAGPVVAAPCGIDCNARTTAYIQTGQYFGIATGDPDSPVFDDTVDVNTQRTTLVDGNIGDGGDEGGFAATLNDFDDANVAVVVNFEGHTPTFAGDFGWITDTDENTEGVQPALGVVTVLGGCGDPVVTATEITVDAPCAAPFATLQLDPADQDPLTVLPATAFSASTDVDYSDIEFLNAAEGVLETGSFGVGAWDLNGFQANVAYMPFQTGIGQVIYFANRSTQDGEITVDWIDQSQNSGSFTIGDSLAGSTRAIGPAINAGLPAAQQEGGRLALTITVNVPACQGQLNAQYNVNGDRAFSVATNNCTP